MHADGYLGTLLVFLVAAVIAVPLFRRAGLGAVLGYLAAGVAIGPDGMRFVADPERVLTLSELGVAMLLFVIGLELSPARLWVMRRQVFLTGGLQVGLTTLGLAVFFVAVLAPWKSSVVLALGLALSSTAIGLQLLAERKELTADFGRVAFAILLFQDLIAIPLLAAIPVIGNVQANAQPPLAAALNAVAVIAVVIFGGRYLLRWLLRAVAKTGIVEVFTATALLVVAGNAWLMEMAGLSMGLGAFLAGVLLSDSEYRHELESHIGPFEGLLLGLFFMAVGMAIDLDVIRAQPALILGAVFGLLALKGLVIVLVGRFAGDLPWRRAAMLGAVLAMGGEFGFVVFSEARQAGLIPMALRDQLFAVIGLSMAVTPLLVIAASRWMPKREPKRTEPREPHLVDDGSPRVIVAGIGRMGQIVARLLSAQKIPFTALDTSPDQVDFLRRFGNEVHFGDPARPDLLRAARADRAEVFVLAADDPDESLRIARVVKRLFPHLKVIARARNRQHAFRLMDMGVDVTRETFHSGLVMGRRVLEALGVPAEAAEHSAELFRAHDEALLREQHLVYDDEAALIASAKQARKELMSLFEADARPAADDAPGSARSLPSTDADEGGGENRV